MTRKTTFLLALMLSAFAWSNRCFGVEVLDTALSNEALEIGRSTGTYELGVAVVSGDLDADGLSDLIVGEPGSPLVPGAVGRVHVFRGGVELFAVPNRDLVVDPADWVVTGEGPGEMTGFALATLDFNGDSFQDLAVGAPDADRVYLLFGPFDQGEPSIELDKTAADTKIVGVGGSSFGYSLAAGDFNGDGRSDLAVGAPTYTYNTRAAAGGVFVLLGGEVWDSTPTFDLGSSKADFTVVGELSGSETGAVVSFGDYDGDGVSDLAVGAPGYSPSGKNRVGAAYLILGDASPAKVLDLKDGKADLAIYGADDDSDLGESLAIADVNGDQTDDLIVAARFASGDGVNQMSSGKVYVFYGDRSFVGREEPIQLALTKANLEIFGTGWGAAFGDTVTAVDLDQDGIANIVLSNQVGGGDVYVLYDSVVGSAGVDLTPSVPQLRILNSGVDQYPPFGVGMGVGDFNGDGWTDLAVSSWKRLGPTSPSGGAVHVVKGIADGDLNQDKVCNIDDLLIFKRNRPDGSAGDFNHNGRIDPSDLRVFSLRWGKTASLLDAD